MVGPEVFDSQRAGGYSPLDFPLFGRFVLGFLETERDRGRSVYAEPRSRWSTRPGDGSDTQVKFRETHGGATRAGRMSIGK